MRRLLSLLFAICIMATSIVFFPTVVLADTLELEDHTNMYGVHIHNNSKITRNVGADSSISYTLEIELSSDYALQRGNDNVTSTEDDYYVVDKNGRYLIELWGGAGASTGTEEDMTSGGASGYVYGIVTLKEGDILLYTLGGKGTQTNTVGQGGGANGGGGYGDRGSTTVGGGGGYSAVFMYDDQTEIDKFYENYIDNDGHLVRNVTEVDRLSKYIMIAGGGGGAGSYGTDTRGTAYGGHGGNMSSTSVHLDTSSGYAVSGTVYAGQGGGSTDGTGEYAGNGGSYIPGDPVKTAWGLGKGVQPNDWAGSYNDNLVGGAGGAGNYRGGGGGAGYAGGSGGLMSNIVLAQGIGGGGGGSSFVADIFNGSFEKQNPNDYLIGSKNTDNGGKFHIVYLDDSDDTYLEQVDIEFARTPYFNITEFEAINTITNENGSVRESKIYDFINNTTDDRRSLINIDYTGYKMEGNVHVDFIKDQNGNVSNTNDFNTTTLKFLIPNVNLKPEAPDGSDQSKGVLTLKLTFTPKEEFAGGNNVPLFADDLIEVIPTDTNYTKGDVTFKNQNGYVNVPMHIDPSPVNHTPQGLDPELVVHKVSSLYIDKYADVRNDLSSDWRYFFMESISDHSVRDEWNNSILVMIDGVENTISPDETTRYYIDITATAKQPTGKKYAVLGDELTTQTFTGISVITIAGTGIGTLNDNVIVYKKGLSYTDGKYTLSLDVSSDASGSVIDASGRLPKFTGIEYGSEELGRESTIIIPVDGIYTITLKGGDGGTGGHASLFGNQGGAGGKGGYIQASFAFKQGTILKGYAGANANASSTAGEGADGGEYSYIAVLKDLASGEIDYYLMIAGGGGGGGGSSILVKGSNGHSANDQNFYTPTTPLTDASSYMGGKGSAEDNWLWGSGNSGSAYGNYVYRGMINGTEGSGLIEGEDAAKELSTSSTNAGGSASMKCENLGFGSGIGNEAAVGKYTIETAISKYFTVHTVEDIPQVTVVRKDDGTTPASVNVSLQRIKEDGTTVLPEDIAEDYLFTRVIVDIDLVPTTKSYTTDSVTKDIAFVDYTLNIVLVPREGFLGGNDVELIAAKKDVSGLLTGMKLSQSTYSGNDEITTEEQFINIDEDRTLDYANVTIPGSLIDSITLETQNKTYIYGGTPVIKKDLVKSVKLLDLEKEYTWEDDYIKLIDPRNDTEELRPEKTTVYQIEAGYGPLYDEPYATVHTAAVNIVKTEQATVYTNAKVTYAVTGVTPDNIEKDSEGNYTQLITFGEGGHANSDYSTSFTLIAMGNDVHYHMPNEITVEVAGEKLVAGTDYVYTRKGDTNADLLIYKGKINGDVLITVEACHESYMVSYLYQKEPESSEYEVVEIKDRHYGEPIEMETDFESVGKDLPAKYDHYDLKWTWDGGNSDPVTVMPKRNVVAVGRYVPKEYDITITYQYADGTLIRTDTHSIAHNTEFTIKSDEIAGYIADKLVISDIVDGSKEQKYVVTYSSAEGKLTINYVYEDGKEAAEPYSQQLEYGASYEVISPPINGYTPDLSIVSGTMDDDGEVHTVTYSPNTYTVTFDPNGGSISNIESTKSVEYDSIYGQLPTPVKLGYTFEGWKLNDQLIDSNTVVKITEDTTLTASWKGLSFTVAIKYVSEEGEELRPSTINSHEIGTDYSYTSPQIEGYNCETPIVSGKMPAQNVVVIVLYTKVKYTVTIYFTCLDSNVELPETIIEEYKHGESYSITVPTISGYTSTLNVVSGVINADNVEVTVYYYESVDDITITWGTMNFEYNKGIWDPQTHTYSNGSFSPIGTTNYVTFTNSSSSTDFEVDLLYYASSQYPTIRGIYSNTEGTTITSVTLPKANGDPVSVTVFFNIREEIEGDSTNVPLGSQVLPDNFISGNCTVSIKEKGAGA